MRLRLPFVSAALAGVSLLAPGSVQSVPLSLQIFADGVLIGDLDETSLGCVDTSSVTAQCQIQDVQYGTEYPLLNIDEINLEIDSDPIVTGVTGVTNLFSSTQLITLVFTLPVTPILTATLTGGSFRGTVTDNDGDGATISTAAGSALYTALLDGANWQSLYPDSFSKSAGSHLSANISSTNFGSPIPSLVGPSVLASIGIRLEFNLTAFDSASFTSNHVVIPVPEPQTGVLVAMGLSMLATRRRRIAAK
jgi:hypothetical protein